MINGRLNSSLPKVNQVIKVYSKEILSPVLFGKIVEANVSFSGDEEGGKYWITDIKMIEKSITSLEFNTIEKGFFSGITEKKNLVIRTQDEQAKLWNKHTSMQIPPPDVVVTAVLTQPYHIMRIEKSNLLVEFKKPGGEIK